jgi:hypothetical protein
VKRPLIILAAAICLGALGYCLAFKGGISRERAITRQTLPSLAWLKTEYQLSNEEFARICALHNAYTPGCTQMCNEIKLRNSRIQSLIASTNTVTSEIETNLKELSALRLECQIMMLRHFYEVSKSMPPGQAQRYIAEMERQTSLLNSGLKHD